MDNKTWILNSIDKNSNDSTLLLESEIGSDFLMIWSLFEARCFGGFMKVKDIKSYNSDCNNDHDEMNEIFNHFFMRYQDNEKLRKLEHKYKNDWFRSILSKDKESITSIEKTRFIIFVIYRYRNNIFHGSKKISIWSNYSDQIEKCIYAMKKIYDLHTI